MLRWVRHEKRNSQINNVTSDLICWHPELSQSREALTAKAKTIYAFKSSSEIKFTVFLLSLYIIVRIPVYAVDDDLPILFIYLCGRHLYCYLDTVHAFVNTTSTEVELLYSFEGTQTRGNLLCVTMTSVQYRLFTLFSA